MNIANNILKHSLQNVYFLTGTSLAGKTTMTKELSKKYGFIPFHDNHNEPHFKVWQSICNEKYQPLTTSNKNIADWETHFNRPLQELIEESIKDMEENALNTEYFEYVLIELIKLSQNNKVIADVCSPIHLMAEISEYNKVACLLASPELVSAVNYGNREDHKDWLEWVMSFKEHEKIMKLEDESARITTERIFDEVEKSKLFSIVRTKESTVANTLKILEKHFCLERTE